MKVFLTLFSALFILWVVFGAEAGDAKADKKKKESSGGGFLWAALFAPFVLIGWIFFALGQMLLLLFQALAALWENLTPLFRKLFEMLGKILGWIWALFKKLLKNIGPLLKSLMQTIRFALKTLWNALEGIFKMIIRSLRSLFSFVGDLIRDFPGVLRTIHVLLKPFIWLLRMLRNIGGKILDWLFFLTDGLLLWIGRSNRKTKEYVSRDIEETDPTDAADLFFAAPLAVATAATRTQKKMKHGRQRLASVNPLKKGITKKRGKNDPHIMERLQSIGWETRRKLGKT